MTGEIVRITRDLEGRGGQPFEGPLELLLYLIQQDEIDIYDIPIAEITHQYLCYLEAMRELNLEIAGEFIVMAATLIQIKARMLLPRSSDDQQFEDPRTELVKALLEYKVYREAAQTLAKRGEMWLLRHARCANGDRDGHERHYVLRRTDVAALMIAFGELMSQVARKTAHRVEPEEVTIEQRIAYVMGVLQSKEAVEFARLFEEDRRRIVMVVTFLAILELARLGRIRIAQRSPFGRIWLRISDIVT